MAAKARRNTGREGGFTLLELLLAMAIFALLAVGCWRLFDSIVRAERAYEAQASELRRLSRALALIQRDALHGMFPAAMRRGGQAVALEGARVRWLRSGARDNPSLPRSQLRLVEYWVEEGVLWRHVRTLENAQGRPQRLLEDVSQLSWRFHAAGSGWQTRWPLADTRDGLPQALEIRLSTHTYRHIRRVLAFGEGQ